MLKKPGTFGELLEGWPTLELASDLGVPYVTARKMRERQSVSIIHWPKLIERAKGRGHVLSYDDLVAMRSRKEAA